MPRVPSCISRLVFALLALIHLFPASVRAELSFQVLRSFPVSMYPSGDLVQGDDGYFYGVTTDGGMHHGGTLYRLATDGSLQIMHHFPRIEYPRKINGRGAHPEGTLVKGDDGTLYGNTREGGVHANGTFFSYQPSTGHFSTVYHFDFSTGYNRWNLTIGPGDALYGTTGYGGSKWGGTVFRVSREGTLTILHEFLDYTQNPDYRSAKRFEPYTPNSILVGQDGVIHGTTSMGGPVETPGGKFLFTYGTAFRLDPDGAFTLLHEFSLGCEHPRIWLRAADGSFYGAGGGLYDTSVFKLTPEGEFSVVKALSTWEEGRDVANLLLGSDGLLYGTTRYGGQFGPGTIFRVSLAGDYQRLYDYPNELYGFPRTGLIEGSDGALYGATTAPDLTKVPDAPEEQAQALAVTATALPGTDAALATNAARVAKRSMRSSRRNGAFRINLRPDVAENRAPIVPSEVITVRRVGTTGIFILRNDKDPDRDPLQVKELSTLPEGLAASFDPAKHKLVLETFAPPMRTAVLGYTVTDGTADSRGNLVIRPAFAGAYGWQNEAGDRLQLTLTAKGVLKGVFKVNGQIHRLHAAVGLDDTIRGAINASLREPVTGNLTVTGSPYQISGTLTVEGTVYEITALRR